MFNKILIITALLMLGGCGGIQSLPNMPSLPAMPSVPSTTTAEAPLACVREGDGFLSFTYEAGHLEALTLKLSDEEITLSRGVTMIRKVPLGIYRATVTGYQKEPTQLRTNLICDGETKAYAFRLDVPSSLGDKTDVIDSSLIHSTGELRVGSLLDDFNVKLTKLDAPHMVFKDPACSESEHCPPTDSQVFVGPTKIKLPEGEYFIKASSGGGKATYIDASSYTAIEVTGDGVEITSQKIVVPDFTQQSLEVISNGSGILRGLLKN